MPSFETPEPISVQIELSAGDVWIKASDRADTVVEVRPANGSRRVDISAAEQTQVDYTAGRLVIRAPRNWRRHGFLSSDPSVDVMIELPIGSTVRAEAAWTTFRCEGQLGDCRFQTGGAVRLGHTGALEAEISHGDLTVDRVVGHAHVTTSSGKVRIGDLDGTAMVKNSSGDCWIGAASGDVRVRTASGDICVEKALAGVAARTAHGGIRIGEAVRGTMDLRTSNGGIEIGVRAGTAAWLDVGSRRGRVHNNLDTTSAPAPGDETVEIHASTSNGNITIHRC